MSKQAVESLHEALLRLLDGKPIRVKPTGRITLNKINNEAGFGRSYIHKFKSFIENVADPAIEKYNHSLDKPRAVEPEVDPAVVPESMEPSLERRLRADLAREEKLKVKYREDRDDYRARLKKLEVLYNTLMYRVHELQEERRSDVYEVKGENEL